MHLQKLSDFVVTPWPIIQLDRRDWFTQKIVQYQLSLSNHKVPNWIHRYDGVGVGVMTGDVRSRIITPVWCMIICSRQYRRFGANFRVRHWLCYANWHKFHTKQYRLWVWVSYCMDLRVGNKFLAGWNTYGKCTIWASRKTSIYLPGAHFTNMF